MKQTYYILKTSLFLILLKFFCVSSAQDTITDDEILKVFDGLRVADVSDGMDMVGLRDAGLLPTANSMKRSDSPKWAQAY